MRRAGAGVYGHGIWELAMAFRRSLHYEKQWFWDCTVAGFLHFSIGFEEPRSNVFDSVILTSLDEPVPVTDLKGLAV